jgi:hypothetical protein
MLKTNKNISTSMTKEEERHHRLQHIELSNAFWRDSKFRDNYILNNIGIYEHMLDVYIAALYLYKIPAFTFMMAHKMVSSDGFKEGYAASKNGTIFRLEHFTYDRWIGWICYLLEADLIPIPSEVFQGYAESYCRVLPQHYTVQ